MAHPLLNDPFVALEIDRATAAYRDMLSEDDFQWMCDQLAQLLIEEPVARQLLAGAHPRHLDRSGAQIRLGESVFSEAEADDAAEPGGRGPLRSNVDRGRWAPRPKKS